MNPNEALAALLGPSTASSDNLHPALVPAGGASTDDPYEATRMQAVALLMQQDQERQALSAITAAITPIEQQAVDIQQALALDGSEARGLPAGWEQTKESDIARKGKAGKGTPGNPTMYADASDLMSGKSDYYRSSKNPPQGTYISAQDNRVSGNINSMISAIKAADGIDAKLAVYANLQTAAAQEASKAMGDAQKQAEVKLGVDRLEQLLAQNEAADRAHPMWNKVQSDSDETARVRAQLESARMKAAALADTYLKQNPALAAMQVQVKMAGNMLELDAKNQQRKEDREDRQAERRANMEDMQNFQAEERDKARKENAAIKAEQEAETLARKELEVTARYQPKQFARMRAIIPDFADATDTEIAKVLSSGKKAMSPEQEMVLKAGDQELLQLAAVRNQYASKLVVEEEAAKTGVPESELKMKLTKLSSNMTVDGYRRMVLSQYPDTNSAGYKEAMALAKTGSVGTKEEQAAFQKHIYDAAVQGMRLENTRDWMSNISKNWQFSDPRIKAAAEAISHTTGQPASLQDLAMKLRADNPRSSLADISDAMRKEIFANRRTGLLTETDPMAAHHAVQLILTRPALGLAMEMALNNTVQLYDKTRNLNPLASAYDFLLRSPSKDKE